MIRPGFLVVVVQTLQLWVFCVCLLGVWILCVLDSDCLEYIYRYVLRLFQVWAYGCSVGIYKAGIQHYRSSGINICLGDTFLRTSCDLALLWIQLRL